MSYLDTFYAGDPLGAVLAVFTDPMGAWFYAITSLTLVIMLYIKTEDTVIPLSVGALMGTFMVTLLPPEASRIGTLLIALAVVGGLYKLLRRE